MGTRLVTRRVRVRAKADGREIFGENQSDDDDRYCAVNFWKWWRNRQIWSLVVPAVLEAREGFSETVGGAWRRVRMRSMIGKTGFFWAWDQRLICVISLAKKMKYCGEKGLVWCGAEAKRSGWLVKALGLWYHVEDLNLMRMENIIKEIEREGENGG